MSGSSYRFSAMPTDEEQPRSRTGLAGVNSGAAAGGEGYRKSALMPGARGFMAASFGNEPHPDYVAPVTPSAPEPTPAPAAPPLAPAPAPAVEASSQNVGEGAGAVGEVDSTVSNQPASGYLADILGGLGLSTGEFGGPASDNNAASAAGGSASSAAAGFGGGYGTGLDGWGGLAEGGRVGPGHLEYGKQAMQPHGKKGLGGVGGAFMGGYADGGTVAAPAPPLRTLRTVREDTLPGAAWVTRDPSDTQGAPLMAGGYSPRAGARAAPIYSSAPGGEPAYDQRLNGNLLGAEIQADVAQQGFPPRGNSSNPMEALLAARPDLLQSLIEQMGSRHPVNPGSPSTGNLGAYAQGGPVPNYAEGGEVDEASLAGPNPPGPDDGFAALDGGEYVVQAQQAQRPDYASVLSQINEGTYEAEDDDENESMSTEGMMPAEGHGAGGGDVSALPPVMQQALHQAAMADPVLAMALAQLLGPDAASSLVSSDAPPDGAALPRLDGRPPLAGPPPMPGTTSPPGVPPPPSAMPPDPRKGLAAVAA